MNIDFSAALEANNDLCSLVGWHTDIFDKIVVVAWLSSVVVANNSRGSGSERCGSNVLW